MEKKYEFLEHTADIKFQAFGKSVEEVFKNSASAMFNAMCNGKIKEKKSFKINVKGKDFESLLYNFLEELLFLFDSENFFMGKIKKMEISKDISDKGNLVNKKQKGWAKKSELASDKGGHLKLKAEILGDDAKNYEIYLDVKAVIYNEMFVREQGGKWIAQVVLDV